MQIPSFSISLNSVLSAINSKSLLSFLSSAINPSYGIYYADGDNENSKALNFNSVISFQHSGDAVITSAPVASINGVAGSYSSVNKVNQPSKITMRIAAEGLTGFSGNIPRIPYINMSQSNRFSFVKDSRTEIINKLEEMKSKATVYNIETPDRVYPNYDLVNYALVMNAKSGVTLLAVDLTFQEIRTLKEISEAFEQVKETTTQEVKRPTMKRGVS